MSMMKSNTMSVMKTAKVASFVLSRLSRRQAFASVDHVERNYGYQVSKAGLNKLKWKTHPHNACDTRFKNDYSHMICRYLPSIANMTSATHTPIAIAITILSMFQIAILPGFLSLNSGG